MRTGLLVALLLGFSMLELLLPPRATAAVDYDIVYVRAPRFGDDVRFNMPEVKDPILMPPGADLVLLKSDGSEEVLVPGGDGAIVDPFVSFDGKWIYYAKFHDQRKETQNYQRRDASRAGSDIYKINVDTRQIVQLTAQEWTPNTGVANWSNNPVNAQPSGTYYLGYGIFNLGPCPLPNGKIMFTSSRNGFAPNDSFTFPNLQLFVMDDDGKNVELVGHLNLGSALHPNILTDGRVMFSSYEAQGLRDSRLWGLWAMWPDGRNWEPLMSAFTGAAAFHFQTELPNRDIAVVEYYNQNNNGFGTILAFNPSAPAGAPPFGQPQAGDPSNPSVRRGIWWFDESHPSHKKPRYKSYPFSPPGIRALSGFAHGEDNASSRDLSGGWAGKTTHPSGAPNNDVLLVWSSGPANDLNRPTNLPAYDGGLYLLANSTPVNDHQLLVKIKDEPEYNELQPRAVVPYSDIYGIEEPVDLPWLPNDGTETAQLPAGTPFGLIGSSSFYKRNTTPGKGSSKFDGLDPFNTSQNGASSNWGTQGADAGKYDNSDIYAVRLLAMEPSSHTSYGSISNKKGFYNHANERLRILGEIPLRKTDGNGDPILDPDGNPDTSFLAKIPADTPFTFQTLDRDGLALNTSQTWHQVRPGEVRNNCGGCHAHSQTPTDFNQTAAAKAGYQLRDLFASSPLLTKDGNGEPALSEVSERAVDVEYYRDIKPILQRSCVGCHSESSGTPAAQLVLDDTNIVDGYDNTYNRLARDSDADYGIKPIISNGKWRQTNASRYIRKFQSRRSLLIWKIFGRRLDGWTNADHPTESVPGDPSTLPAGAKANDADIDFTGTIMPPPNSHAQYPPLSEDEKITFARWVDLGCPIDTQNPSMKSYGWFGDDLRPTLTISLPRAGLNSAPLTQLRIGMLDYYSGLDAQTLSVTADFSVNGNAPGTELASLFNQSGDHIWTLPLSPAVSDLNEGLLTVSVKDVAGNITKMARTFSVGGGGGTVPTPPAISSFIAQPTTVSAGDSSTISWLIGQGAATLTDLRIDPDVGSVLGMSQTVVTPQATTNYTLTATNPDGVATAQVTIVVEDDPKPQPPVINQFTSVPSEIVSGESAKLEWKLDEGSSPLTNLTIQPDVGDVTGNSTATVTPVSSTTYTLTATSVDGSDSARTTITVDVPDNAVPIAHIAATPKTGAAPLEVKFDGAESIDRDGKITRYAWDFGDGKTATGEQTTHRYRAPGRYTTTLTVTDDDGAVGSARQGIVVSEQPPLGGDPKVEIGRLSRVTSRWHTVRMRNRYESMVVVATVVLPSTKVGPVVPRIRNTKSNKFQICLQSPDGRRIRGRYDVHFLAAEEGTYSEAEHGLKMEAVRVRSEATAGAGNWIVEPRTYKNAYQQPVVFGQVLSFEDKRWSVFWASGARPGDPPAADIFNAGKHVGEDPDPLRKPETIGYIVFEAGANELNDQLGFFSGLGAETVVGTGDSAEGTLYPISGVERARIGILSSAGMNGGNGGWPVLLRPRPVTDVRLRLAIDEDQLGDDERNHIGEQVAFAAFGGIPVSTEGVQIPPESASSFSQPVNSETFENWRQWHFGEDTPAALPSEIAYTDTDKDGSNDYLEFAFDTDPNNSSSHATPFVEMDSDGMRIVYQRPKDRPQLRFVVESSSDLHSWSVATGESEMVKEDDYTDTIHWHPAPTQDLRYFRVRVDSP